MDVVGRHALDTFAMGEFDECIVAGGVEWVAVVPQLHQHPVAPERIDQPEQLPPGRRRAVGDQRCGHRTLAAPGEHPAVPGDGVGDIAEGELRRPLLTGQVSVAQHPGESGVPAGAIGEHEEMCAGRIRRVRVGHHPRVDLTVGVAFSGHRLSLGGRQPDLAAEHGRETDRLGRFGESDHPVEAVVVGDRQRLQAETCRFGRQLLGM